MEQDFKVLEKETEQKYDKLGIPYVWRDSCAHILAQMKICMRNDWKTNYMIFEKFSECKGMEEIWKKCEFEREYKLNKLYTSKYSILDSAHNEKQIYEV